MLLHPANKPPKVTQQPAKDGGLRVRTNLRAGLTGDDLANQAKELWNSLTSAVSNTVSSVTGSTPSTTASS